MCVGVPDDFEYEVRSVLRSDPMRTSEAHDAAVLARARELCAPPRARRLRYAVPLALAAYNGGPTRTHRWVDERPGLSQEEFIDDIPVPETQNYVKRILGTAEDYRRLYRPEGSDQADAVPAVAHAPAPAPAAAKAKAAAAEKPAVKKAAPKKKPAARKAKKAA